MHFEQLFRSILWIVFAPVLAHYTLYNFLRSISWIDFCCVVTCYLKKHVYLHDFALHRKGVVHELSAWRQGAVDAEWEQWVDAHSPNARTVLKSFLPSVLYKSLLYALSPQDVICNLRSLLWGLGMRAYPDQWWRPMLLRFFQRFKLHRILGFKVWIRWFQEGRGVVVTSQANSARTPVHRC